MPRSTAQHSALPPFQWVLDEHAAGVMRFLVHLTGPQEAEDCFQETMVAALRAYPELEHGRNLRGWLMTIARRKAIDNSRAAARRPLLVDDEVLFEAVDAGDDGVDPLWETVRALPAKQRRAIGLRFGEDRSYTDIAGAMSTTAVRLRTGTPTVRRSQSR